MPTLLPAIFFFIFLVLLGKSLVHVYNYYKTKDTVYLKKIKSLWVIPFTLVLLFLLLVFIFGRVDVDRGRIIGHYEVDTNFYPGPNANWQKEHYRFEITKDNKLILYEKLADSTERQYFGDINWSFGPPDKWSISMKNQHHVIDKHPTLYRSNKKFYYVFKTKNFGNMFFRKI